MDLRQEIATVTGKKQTRKIATYIGSDQERFDALMEVFYAGPYRLTQKAAWVMGHYASAAFRSRGSKVLRELEKIEQ